MLLNWAASISPRSYQPSRDRPAVFSPPSARVRQSSAKLVLSGASASRVRPTAFETPAMLRPSIQMPTFFQAFIPASPCPTIPRNALPFQAIPGLADPSHAMGYDTGNVTHPHLTFNNYIV